MTQAKIDFNNTEKAYLRDEVVSKIFSDASLHEYVELIVSKALDLDINLVKDNLIYRSPLINTNVNEKESIVDAVYESDKAVVNIEINYSFSNELEVKNMRYICHLLLDQIGKGDRDKIKNVYQINISNYDIFHEGKFIYRSYIMESTLHKIRDDFITIVYIDVDFLSKIYYTKIKEEESDSLEKLLYIFVCDNKEKLDEVYIDDTIMKKVQEKISSLTENFADGLYYSREDLINAHSREVGAKEAKEEDAKNMLNDNVPINKIQQYTGLSIREINALKNNEA